MRINGQGGDQRQRRNHRGATVGHDLPRCARLVATNDGQKPARTGAFSVHHHLDPTHARSFFDKAYQGSACLDLVEKLLNRRTRCVRPVVHLDGLWFCQRRRPKSEQEDRGHTVKHSTHGPKRARKLSQIQPSRALASRRCYFALTQALRRRLARPVGQSRQSEDEDGTV